ncbi:Translation initiation factor IF-2 [Frankliniella fusca]|uniref:Translation initiation factor IF-2 n=1 Tax=Frankliniella fusca TaxID=407009 RepID=A0AAE1LTT9_9NEOP|nr:Translation initiation factor IF-2 [Frankliniella fusca]
MIHVNVHHFKNSAHQIEVKLTKPFSAGKKVLLTHSVRLVNVSVTLYNDLKSRGGSLSSRPRRPWLKDGRRHSARARPPQTNLVYTTCQPRKLEKDH